LQTGNAVVVEDTFKSPEWIDLPKTRWIRSHLSAPIRIKGQVIGCLNLDSATPGFFSPTHIPRLQAFADQAALALENARLLGETAKRASYFAALHETAQAISGQQDLSAVLETIVERAIKLLEVPHGDLYLYDVARGDLELVVHRGYSLPVGTTRLRMGEGMAGQVAQTRQPIWVKDYRTWEHRSPQFDGMPFSAQLQVPLVHGGELIGVLTVSELGDTTREFTEEDARLLGLFAGQVAGAVRNARSLEESHTRAEQLTLLYDAGLALNSILEPRAQLEFLLTIAMRALKADRAIFFRNRDAEGSVELEVCVGYAPEDEPALRSLNTTIGDEANVIGWVATQHLPLNLPDVSADLRYPSLDPNLRSGLWLPVERENQFLGVLGVESVRPAAFRPAEERLLGLFANQAAVALENARLFGELQSSLQILTRLFELSAQFLNANTLEEIGHLATRTMRASFAADSAWLDLFDAQGNLEFTASDGWDASFGDISPRPDGLSSQVWRSGTPMVIHDQATMHPALRMSGAQTVVVLPLRDEPSNLGVLFLNYSSLHSFSEREMELRSLFANQVALAIKRTRLTTETHQRIDQLALLNRIAGAINQTMSLDELLRVIHRETVAILPSDAFFIALYDSATHELDYRIQIDQGMELTPRRRVLSGGMSAQVISERKPLLIRNRLTDSRLLFSSESLWGTMRRAVSWLGAPMLIGDAVVGIISVQAYTPNRYDEADEQLLVTIADQVAVAIQRARLFEETRQRLSELEAVNEISKALRVAHTSSEMLPLLLDATLKVMRTDCGSAVLTGGESQVRRETAARGWLADFVPEEKHAPKGIRGHVLATGEPYVSAELRMDPLLSPETRSRIPSGWGGICLPIRTTEQPIGVLLVAVALPRVLQPNEVQLLTTIAEMAGNAIHRATLHEQTERRLSQLNALHTIDTAINASLDLRVTLNILLTQVSSQLAVDAVDVLLLEPVSRSLRCAAGVGFRTRTLSRLSIPFGEGYPGRLVLDRQILHLTALDPTSNDPRARQLAGEGFVTYCAAPLISKGQIKGVLEIFHRTPLEVTSEWLDFLGMLAGQAALAIENATLFDSLQRSNVELELAYDSTIEGWSHALDLRSRETEGHTQRITDMACRVALAVGIDNSLLRDIRRGAMMHDIGMMAIPDHVLLKPGRFSEADAELMRKHPQYGYDLLSSIEYLRGALDIPYYHHEKWNGTGYPRGLKGEEIPLAARIFAIVDVWDALLSERPYRPAWGNDQVMDYLKAQSGIHFDPKILEVFLRLVEE
jgi:GAF domain-containing protein